MGLWIMVPIALLAGILLWDRERLFTVEKSLAVLNLVVAAPWFISMGLENGADLFDERLFQVGWYLAAVEIVVGVGALVAGWRRYGLESVLTSGIHAKGVGAGLSSVAGGTSGAAGISVKERPFGWKSVATRMIGASPWILGYGLVLAALMGWIGRTI